MNQKNKDLCYKILGAEEKNECLDSVTNIQMGQCSISDKQYGNPTPCALD